jgi:hypothetical protein
MAVENFEQILCNINNTEIRIALERLFALVGVGTGSDGTSLSQDVVGNLTGNVSGNVTGDQLGNMTGDVTGDVNGNEVKQLTTYSADTDLDDTDLPTTMIDLNGSTASTDVTKFTPEPGKTYVISCSDVGTADPSITASSGITLDGTNDKATFDAADECLIIFCINATTCLIVENIGGVVLS